MLANQIRQLNKFFQSLAVTINDGGDYDPHSINSEWNKIISDELKLTFVENFTHPEMDETMVYIGHLLDYPVLLDLSYNASFFSVTDDGILVWDDGVSVLIDNLAELDMERREDEREVDSSDPYWNWTE
jgi:hypothetical protein